MAFLRPRVYSGHGGDDIKRTLGPYLAVVGDGSAFFVVASQLAKRSFFECLELLDFYLWFHFNRTQELLVLVGASDPPYVSGYRCVQYHDEHL